MTVTWAGGRSLSCPARGAAPLSTPGRRASWRWSPCWCGPVRTRDPAGGPSPGTIIGQTHRRLIVFWPAVAGPAGWRRPRTWVQRDCPSLPRTAWRPAVWGWCRQSCCTRASPAPPPSCPPGTGRSHRSGYWLRLSGRLTSPAWRARRSRGRRPPPPPGQCPGVTWGRTGDLQGTGIWCTGEGWPGGDRPPSPPPPRPGPRTSAPASAGPCPRPPLQSPPSQTSSGTSWPRPPGPGLDNHT